MAASTKASSSPSHHKRNPSGGNTKHTKKAKTAIDTSNLSSSKQKRVLKHERQSHRRHADVVKESKDIWNQLRLKTNTKDQIQPLVERLMVLLFTTDTTLCEIALQHDASRVVQAALQFAVPADRVKLATALAPQLPDMAKSQYAHFIVLKLIQYGHRQLECIHVLCKAFKSHLVKLATHAVGARVVELFFSTIPHKHTNALKQEFYGPHFSLFSSDTPADGTTTSKPTLQSNILAQPDKKESACDYLYKHVLQKGMDKALFGFAYFQQLLSEYCSVLTGTELLSAGIISSLVDHTLHLLSTRPGAQVMVTCAAYGTAKDRKRMLKALKGYTRSSLLHRDAYLVILQLLLVTDDTVSVQKSLLSELLTMDEKKKTITIDDKDDGMAIDEEEANHPLFELAMDDRASKLFLQLLGADDKYFDPLEKEILQANPTIVDPKVGAEVTTYKKNPETRRIELASYLELPLMQLCLQHTRELATCLPGSRVLQHVVTSNETTKTEELISSLVQLCCTLEAPMLEDNVAHYMVKHLTESSNDFAAALSKSFWANGQLLTSSRAAFIATALLEKDQRPPTGAAVTVKQLQRNMAACEKKKQATAGFEALLKQLKDKK